MLGTKLRTILDTLNVAVEVDEQGDLAVVRVSNLSHENRTSTFLSGMIRECVPGIQTVNIEDTAFTMAVDDPRPLLMWLCVWSVTQFALKTYGDLGELLIDKAQVAAEAEVS